MIKSVKAFKAKWSGKDTILLMITNPARGEVISVEVNLKDFIAKKIEEPVEVEATVPEEETDVVSEEVAND